jgi:predicted nuclease of predicted toxin-antitoxin system
VKLLLDENLSPRLMAVLQDLYLGSLHLRDCGLRGASDAEIWRYASQGGFAIVSKDSDFAQRSALLGGPPKVIWLRIGNCTTARAEFVLRNARPRIQAFETSQETCLVLTHPIEVGDHRTKL